MCRPDEYPPFDLDSAANRDAYLRMLAEQDEHAGPTTSNPTEQGPWGGLSTASWLERLTSLAPWLVDADAAQTA